MKLVSFDDDEELLQLLKCGNEEAYSRLYNKYWDKVFALALSKTKDPYLAEDITQDIFLSLWNNREDLNIEKTVSQYLSVAVKYKLIDYLRKVSKQSFKQNLQSGDCDSYDCDPEQQLALKNLLDTIQSTTTSLPEKCRLVFTLSREKGFSHRAIASLMNISEKTVENHITKALHRLRKAINLFFFLFF